MVRNPSARDDLAVNGKGKLEVLTEKPAANLQRPAHRPLSSMVQKPLAAQAAAVSLAQDYNKPKQVDVPVEVIVRKPLLKKPTAVFREPVEQYACIQTAVILTLLLLTWLLCSAPQPARSLISTAPVHKNLASRHEAPSEGAAKEVVGRAEDLPSIAKLEAPVRREASDAPIASPPTDIDELDTKTAEDYIEILEEQARLLEKKTEEVAKQQPEPAEAEWEEEDEQEFYDAEGYTTARSLRSRGDTTGGLTVPVVAPTVNAAVERELEAARVFVEQNRTTEELDDELWDTSMVAEYGEEIFEYMRDIEERMRPNPFYMDNQTEIQWSMRSVLIDWVVQVHHRFNLLPETLFLCINYIDRFLSVKVVSLAKLQLVGATALFVAAKYEEINCPSVQEMVYMVDGGYTVDEILKAERFMLSMLQFELGWPGPMSFLRRISKADDYDLETRTLAKYFLEITIMDERFVSSKPSYLSAGAHCLALYMLKKGDWSLAHVHYSGYTLNQLRSVMNVMLECCETPTKHHQAIYNKYTDKRYKSASLFVEAEVQRGFVLPSPIKKADRCSIAADLTQSWRLASKKAAAVAA